MKMNVNKKLPLIREGKKERERDKSSVEIIYASITFLVVYRLQRAQAT